MNFFSSRLFFVLSFFVAAISAMPANADIVQYRFSGVLPGNGASSHSMVANGESFVATFLVDDSVADSDTSPLTGRYSGAVVSGHLEFSGGFVSASDFSEGLHVLVANNVFGDLDGVVVRADSGIDSPFFGALTEDTELFDSDVMPAVGTSFVSDTEVLRVAFSYEDQFGMIDYPWASLQPITFSVSAIPEPASGICIAMFGLLAALRRRVSTCS